MLQVRIIDRTEDFAALRACWNRLLANSAAAGIFLTHEWLYTWWLVYGGRHALHIVLLSGEEGEPVGILPAYIAAHGLLPRVRVLRLLGDQVVGSDFLDAIAARGQENAVVQQLAAYLQTAEGWDLAELTALPEDALLLRVLADPPASRHIQPIEEARQTCPFIAFNTEPSEHWARLKNKARRKIRGLEPHGPLAVERLEDPAAVAEALPTFVALHQQRRTEKGDPGIFVSEASLRFHAELCRAASEAGWLQLCFLTVAGQRVAGVYQFRYADRIFYYQTGYDLAWGRYSVGFVLFTLLIDQARCEGCLGYEFLRGDESYKYTLGATGERRLVGLHLHRGTLRARFYLLQRQVVRALRRGVARRTPEGLKTRLKAFLPGRESC